MPKGSFEEKTEIMMTFHYIPYIQLCLNPLNNNQEFQVFTLHCTLCTCP